MQNQFHNKNLMYGRVRTHLRNPQNEPLWLDHPPFLTDLVRNFETAAGELGAFGQSQSASIKGTTQQQNLAETALEDAAYPLARALRLYYRQQNDHPQAVVWDLSETKWRRMREDALLEKARALHAAAQPLTTGSPPPGAAFGITKPVLTALKDLIDDYAEVANAPGAARSDRKAKTSQLAPRYRSLDGILEDMDDLIIALRSKGESERLFVDGYFNARRIGGHASGGGATPATPAPTGP